MARSPCLRSLPLSPRVTDPKLTPRSPQGPGYDTDYHPADLHPRPETGDDSSGDVAAQASEGEKSLGATQADASRAPEAQRPPSQAADADAGANGGQQQQQQQRQQRERKATFMEKMKGEAKVVIGKLEGKKGVEKVQEGRKLKAGEV